MKKAFLAISILAILTITFSIDAVLGSELGGLIAEDMTLTVTNSPHDMTRSVLVNEGVTLTLEPGVTISIADGAGLRINGCLIAQGTEANPITFTSATGMTAGLWNGINFTDTATDATFDDGGNYVCGSILQYCTIKYGGGSGAYGLVQIDQSNPFIDNCIIQYSETSGIFAMNASSLKIYNSTISNNNGAPFDNNGSYLSSLENGGGIYTYGGSVTISDCTITDNATGGYDGVSYGGGIYCDSNSTLTNCTITDNYSRVGTNSYGGGIYCGSNSTLTNCTITDNFSSSGGGSSGGGIYCGDNSMLTNCTIINNYVSRISNDVNSYGGGLYCNGSVALTDCTITGNSSSVDDNSYGGGIYCVSNTTLANCTITHNSSTGYNSYGGGIYCGSDATLTNCAVTNNNSSGDDDSYGGGLYCDGNGTLTDCIITNNNSSGDDDSHMGGDSYGGGLYCGSNVTLTSCTITENTSSSGYGGGIYIYGGTVSDCTITDNITQYAGGIYISSSFNTTISGNTISENTASSNYGGIYIESGSKTAIITNNNISQNTAYRCAGIHVESCVSGSKIEQNVISNNTASGSGEETKAIYCKDEDMVINDNAIYDNDCKWWLYYEGGGTLEATENYWGATSTIEVSTNIYDFFVNPSVGIVNYMPIKTSTDIDIPPATPTGFWASVVDTAVNLSWNANTESDIADYKVYYDTDSGPPYRGTGTAEGDSPISVGNVTSYSLTGLPSGATYFFTVTALDNTGWESGYAQEVSASTTAPAITVSPTSINFGNVNVGSHSNQMVTVKNYGLENLIIGDITHPSAPFSITVDNCSGQTLATGESNTLTVRFSPTSRGTFSSSFDIPSNDPDDNPMTVNLEGTGIGAVIQVELDLLDFGEVEAGLQADEILKISNTGDAELVINNISCTGTFSVSNLPSQPIAPGGEHEITVTLEPQQERGKYTGTVTIESNACNEPKKEVALSAEVGVRVVAEVTNPTSGEYANGELLIHGTAIVIGGTLKIWQIHYAPGDQTQIPGSIKVSGLEAWTLVWKSRDAVDGGVFCTWDTTVLNQVDKAGDVYTLRLWVDSEEPFYKREEVLVVITIDNEKPEPPTFSITSSSGSSEYTKGNDKIIVAGSVEELNLSIAELILHFDGNDIPVVQHNVVTDGTSLKGDFQIGEVSGQVNLSMSVKDRTDNVSDFGLSNNSLSTDNDNPSVIVQQPAYGCNFKTTPIGLSGTASDSTSDVVKVELKFGDGPWEIASGTTNWHYEFDPKTGWPGHEDSDSYLWVRSYDTVGNVSDEVKWWVQFYFDDPNINISEPIDSVSLTDVVEIKGSASDSYTLRYANESEPDDNGEITNANPPPISDALLASWDTSGLDGVYTLYLMVNYQFGQLEVKREHLLISTPTSITIITPNGGERIKGGSICDITWNTTGKEINHIHLLYSIDSGSSFQDIVPETNNDGAYKWTTPDIDSSTVRVKAIAKDASYKELASDTSDGNFTITRPAEPKITYPTSEACLQGTVSISGTASIGNGLKSWTLDVAEGHPVFGAWVEIVSGTQPVNEAELGQWETPSNANGEDYTIRLRVTDTDDNTTVDTVAVIVDNISPSVLVNIASEGACGDYTKNNAKVTVSGNTEPGAIIDKAKLLQQGDATFLYVTDKIEISEEGTISGTLPGYDLTEVTVLKLWIMVKDCASNEGEGNSNTLAVDNEPPAVVKILTPANSANHCRGSIPISGIAGDAGSGIAKVQVDFGGGTAKWVDATGTTDWAFLFQPPAPDVVYTIQARATDNAGNVANAEEIEVKHLTYEPTADITTPHDGDIISCKVKIKGFVDTCSGWTLTWKLEYAPGENASAPTELIKQDNAPVIDDEFASWDTSLLPKGKYTLFLIANNTSNEHQVKINVQVNECQCIPGDINCDGSVTPLDASLVLQHIVGKITLTPEQQVIADVTGDGSISALDAAYILQYCVGITTVFPAQ